jgi:putative NADPH-quinone reductase
MKLVIILAHPYSGSFNHAIAKTALEAAQEKGHTVYFHDLYAEEFPPLLYGEEIPKEASIPQIIAAHVSETTQADGIIIIHPNWWGQPPAILKGWVDRVLRYGAAYDIYKDENNITLPIGLLKAQSALVFNTSNTPPEREINVFGDPLELIWKKCIFSYCGVNNVYRTTFCTIDNSTLEQRQAWLAHVRDMIFQYYS